MSEVGIIGAGVAGLCVAAELVSRGQQVRLYDRAGGPGAHGCSWWAGGMLAPECEGETAEEPVTRLGRDAARWWEQFTPVAHNGSLVVALSRDKGELARFARRTAGHRALGVAELATLEPLLEGRASEALFFAGESHLNPRIALADLVGWLAERGTPVIAQEVDAAHLDAPVVIDCRGIEARPDLPDLRGVRGEMVILRSGDLSLSRPVRLLHPRYPIYLVPRGDGVFMLGATQIESGGRGPASVRSVLELLSAAYALHPAFAEAEVLEIGADARPAFKNNLPRIRRTGRVIHANGLFRHGFLLGPALARMVADVTLSNLKPEFYHED
jgi:glycine oxidase